MPKIFTIGGSKVPNGPKEYQGTTRPRYADVTSPMKSGLVFLQPGYLVEVRERDEGDQKKGTQRVLIATFQLKNGDIKTVETHRIVMATGFIYDTAKFLPNHIPSPTPLTLVKGFPNDAKKEIPIGKQVDNEEIYLTGAAAGHDIVDVNYNVNGGVPIKELGQVEALAFISVLTEVCFCFFINLFFFFFEF